MLATARACRDSGILTGDLNGIQQALLGLLWRVDDSDGWLKVRRMVEALQDAMDLWMRMEHPDVWAEAERARFPEPTAPPQEILGDDMESVIRQVMASF